MHHLSFYLTGHQHEDMKTLQQFIAEATTYLPFKVYNGNTKIETIPRALVTLIRMGRPSIENIDFINLHGKEWFKTQQTTLLIHHGQRATKFSSSDNEYFYLTDDLTKIVFD